jgi:hypothetical protein
MAYNKMAIEFICSRGHFMQKCWIPHFLTPSVYACSGWPYSKKWHNKMFLKFKYLGGYTMQKWQILNCICPLWTHKFGDALLPQRPQVKKLQGTKSS